jgi:hypothetical protein
LLGDRQADVFSVEEIGPEREVRAMLLDRPEGEEQPASRPHRLGELIAGQISNSVSVCAWHGFLEAVNW